jgi:hypothetical protein
LCHTPAEGSRVHVVDERPLVVDLHDRQPLAVPALELGVAVDLDLLEAVLPELGGQRRARPLAEVAAAPAVEDDLKSPFTDRCRGWSLPRRPA